MPDPYGLLVYVLAYGGLRWGEATALRRRRCDLLRSRLHICESLSVIKGELQFGPTKTDAVRDVVLPRFVTEMVAQHLDEQVRSDPDALVFDEDGAPLKNPTFHKRTWRKAIHDVGLDGLRIHDLRHTCAALLIAQGKPVKAVQKHLGHASPTVTLNTYSHVFDTEMDTLWDALDEAKAQPRTASGERPHCRASHS